MTVAPSSDSPQPGRGARARRWTAAGLFAFALIPLFVAPVLPLIDFYNHLARFYVLSHLGSDPQLSNAYQAHWALLPDIGMDVLATPILAFVPPLLAAKLIILGLMAIQFSGLLYFHRALTGQRSLLVAAMLLPLLYSYVLNWGFVNFLLALGLAFWAAGWWLNYRQRPSLAVPVSCLWAVLIYLAHGVGFALYSILLVSLEIGLFLAGPSRKLSSLAQALSRVAVQAIIPFALFLFWEIGQAAVFGAAASPAVVSVPPLVHNGFHRLSTILRVEEGPAYWFDITTFVLQGAIVCFLLWRGRLTLARAAWPLIAIATLLVAAVPSQVFDAFYVSDRMPLFAALCILGAFSFSLLPWTGEIRAACAMLVVIALMRIAAVAGNWWVYNQDYREFQAVAAHIPPGSLTIPVMIGSGHHEFGIPRCEMYGTLLVPLYREFVPLFADPSQHPLILVGALGRAQDRLLRLMQQPDERTTDYNPYIKAAAAAGFDYLLACGTQRLLQPFPQNVDVIAHTPHFAVLHATP